ncbi:MAG: DNA polymerase I [Solirubrobacterales bacterium]
MASKGELFLIDGNSLAYRAFFALPETIATSKGEPTNALFGFASMLVKIFTEYGPKATIVVWDAGLSGREKQYEPYKAERKPRPDLLREQWPHLASVVEAFGHHNVSVKGYEADDVIASLAEQAKQAGIKVMVVTGDRDAYQLPDNGSVSVMTTTRGITDTKIYDREGVIERYGIPPELVADFIGLKGDKSDNIPGVPGIGDKTAAQLLQTYGSLEEVLAHVDDISGAKRQQNLRENAELARVSKELATLNRDIDAGIDVTGVAATDPDRARLREVFSRWELRDPLRRIEAALEGEAGQETPAPPDPAAKIEARRGTPNEIAALPEVPTALAVERGDGALRWAVWAADDAALEGEAGSLAEIVEAFGERPLVAHDWKQLTRDVGPPIDQPARDICLTPPRLAHDTMIGAFLLEPARRGYPLDELLADAGIGTLADTSGVPTRAASIRRLADVQSKSIDDQELREVFEQVELPLVEVLRRIEREGVKLDTYRLGELAAGVADEIDELEHAIWDLAGEQFTIGSPQQLSRVLFEKLELTRKRRGKTGFSTDARVLRSIRDEHPIVAEVEAWRELSKLKSTYFDALPGLIAEHTGRLHTTFNQAGASTGRLSSTSPNLQNIPIRTEMGRRIRSCFVAEPGNVLVSADYSQVELRILAHCAGEQVLKDIFERGEDVHAATAAEVLKIPPDQIGPGERARAKAVNFGIVYGLSAHGLSDQLQIPHEEAAAYIEGYMGRFPAVQRFIEATVADARERGYVRTLFGRRRQIPELRSDNFQTRSAGERLAVNTVIQGTAADIMKIAMVRCDRRLRDDGLETRLVLTIHDELLFEGPKQEAEQVATVVATEMEAATQLDPPLVVDVGKGENWLDAK